MTRPQRCPGCAHGVVSWRTGRSGLRAGAAAGRLQHEFPGGSAPSRAIVAAVTGFTNPDFVAYAESSGARGYQITSASDLLPALTEALAADTVSVITCPVDYSENLQLTGTLGELTGPF